MTEGKASASMSFWPNWATRTVASEFKTKIAIAPAKSAVTGCQTRSNEGSQVTTNKASQNRICGPLKGLSNGVGT